MSFAAPNSGGVRVRIYPQSPLGGGPARLETISLSLRPGEVGPGPSDSRLYVVEAPGKPPYGGEIYRGGVLRPPWTGPHRPAVRPSAAGHFDHLRPSDPGFRQAHLYGCVRYALDVWERYLGRPIEWHFRRHFERLEVVALTGWPNAHMGYGFLEAGQRPVGGSRIADLALDFDVVSHEIGHALMMSFAGRFSPDAVSADYEAFHEASSDLVALVAVLHLGVVVEEFMEISRGNLDSFNRLNRFAELSGTQQIRLANNNRTMADFVRGWRSEHELAEPVIAGFFDAFVEVYNEMLVATGAIPRALEALAERAEVDPSLRRHVQRGFDRAFARRPEPFYVALARARDLAAATMIRLWQNIDPVRFRFADVLDILLDIDSPPGVPSFPRLARGCLAIRGVGIVRPGARVRPPGKDSHMHSSRTATPD